MSIDINKVPNNTLLIDYNEKAHRRGYFWEDYFKTKTDSKVYFAPLPAADILYKNKKGQLIGIEYKEGIDLTISQDSKHMHKQIDNMVIYDKSFVVATEGYRKDYPHNNYWSKWAFKNIHFTPCVALADATEEISNIFRYSNRVAWIPEAKPHYSCLMGAISAIPPGLGIGDKTKYKLYNNYTDLKSLLAETDFTRIGLNKKQDQVIKNSLRN